MTARVGLRLLGVAGAMALAFGLRFYLAAHYVGNFDEASYEIVQGIFRRGGNVYAETTRYNYSPFWFYCLGALGAISQSSGLSAHFVIRCFLTLVDLATAGVLYGLARAVGLPPLRTVLLFVCNPVSILITGYHGQFDNIAVLCLLGSLWVQLSSAPLTPARRAWAWALAAAGVVVKHIVLFAPLFVLRQAFPRWQLRVLAWMLACIPFVLSFLPFVATGFAGIKGNVFAYTGRPGMYGLTSLAPFHEAWLAMGYGIYWLMKALLIGCFLGGSLLASRMPALKAALLCPLIFLAAAPGFGDQYLLWPIAFGALRPSWAFGLYSVAASLYLLGSPDNLFWRPLTTLVTPNVVWVAVLVWLLHELWPVVRPKPAAAAA